MLSSRPLFVYGSLLDREIRAVVVGRAPASGDVSAARLPEHGLFRVFGRQYPLIATRRGGMVHGLLLRHLTAPELRRLDTFEGDEYRRRNVNVQDQENHWIAAQIYWPRPGLRRDRRAWRFDDWQPRERKIMLARAAAWCKEQGLSRSAAMGD